MSEKGLTTIALKKINRSKIYQYIYRSKLTSKLQIVQDLQMGLSTLIPPEDERPMPFRLFRISEFPLVLEY